MHAYKVTLFSGHSLCGPASNDVINVFRAADCVHAFLDWFMQLAGQLGDGAATSIGEVNTAEHGRWELQFKGAGQTPYSGCAALRPSAVIAYSAP